MNSKSGTDKEENPSCGNDYNSEIEREAGDSNAAMVIDDVEDSSVGNNDTRETRQTRTPFTNLSQVDADLALARTLQEQERAYMMIRMNGDGSDYRWWEAGSHVPDEDDFDGPSEDEYDGSDADDNDDDVERDHDEYDEDENAFDVHAHDEDGDDEEEDEEEEDDDDDNPEVELDPANFSSDGAYARALQDAEDREMAARMRSLAGINERESEVAEDHVGNSQDNWDQVDPDEFSYEELLALGDVVGTASRGLCADTIASLPSLNYKMQSNEDGNIDSCVICQLDYEDGETLTVLSCKHSYHSECINNWLQINKVCPVCSAEVSTSSNS